MELMTPIRDKGYALIDNFWRVIQTSDLDYVLCGMPIWKHIYHALYWLDYRFDIPASFIGAPFHEPGLESLDVFPSGHIAKEQLLAYYRQVSEKSRRYLDNLTDDMLGEQPEGCDTNRLGLILSQFRHAYVHIGNINCTTIIETGKWPLVAASAADNLKGLYE